MPYSQKLPLHHMLSMSLAALGHKALRRFIKQLCCPADRYLLHSTTRGSRQALHYPQHLSRHPQASTTQKDTVMRNPPKRNMKTKSAVLPRKEPSSSMRQYLYLRAGDKGGVAV